MAQGCARLRRLRLWVPGSPRHGALVSISSWFLLDVLWGRCRVPSAPVLPPPPHLAPSAPRRLRPAWPRGSVRAPCAPQPERHPRPAVTAPAERFRGLRACFAERSARLSEARPPARPLPPSGLFSFPLGCSASSLEPRPFPGRLTIAARSCSRTSTFKPRLTDTVSPSGLLDGHLTLAGAAEELRPAGTHGPFQGVPRSSRVPAWRPGQSGAPPHAGRDRAEETQTSPRTAGPGAAVALRGRARFWSRRALEC